MSVITGTARTGEAAAVAEAPLFNGRPLIFDLAPEKRPPRLIV
jgi:hypothetical protein